MKRLMHILIAGSLLGVFLLPSIASATDTLDPAEIVQGAVDLDGTTIVLEGEAIGDVLHADDGHVWLNVLGDQGVAIGVWLDDSGPDSPREAISMLGEYETVGDRVRIEGVFNAACDRHGGDLDVHADEFSVIEAGSTVEHQPKPVLGIAGIVLLLVAGVLAQVYRRHSIPIMDKD